MATTVKVFYNDDIRRITLTEGQQTYTQLLQTIFNLYPTLKGTSFVLKYKDSEGDFISLTSQPDFEEALAQLPSSAAVLRLFVHIPSKPAPQPSPAQTPEPSAKPADASRNPPQPDFDAIGAQAKEVLAQFGVPEDEAKEMINSGLSFVRAFLQPQQSSCSSSCASASTCNSSCSCDDAKSTSNCCGSSTTNNNSESTSQCTFATFGKRYVPQHWFNCFTCGLARGEGVCGICAKTCHAGHQLVYVGVSAAYCDCGAGARGPCKSLRSSETTTPTTQQEEKPYQIPVHSENSMETEEEEEETCQCHCGGGDEEEEETERRTTPFEEKLKTLADMGFLDRARNIRALIAHRGDVNGAIALLLNGNQY